MEGGQAGASAVPSTPAPRDVELVTRIKTLVDDRPSYGYRRMTAVLNRGVPADARVNHKRVYRVMRDQKLLLERSTGRPRRIHDGTIMTLKSNMRWCSDAFEIACWNGERVQVAFSLDCCDREVLSIVATAASLDGEMIRDLMLDSVEHRFGPDVRHLPTPIEWLTDNGPIYVSTDTVTFGEALGFVMCTTPPYSPESNGMAEAFVKTFKRDYVYVNERPTAAEVIAQLPGWFADYNNTHPHKALNMLSPLEYRTLNQAA